MTKNEFGFADYGSNMELELATIFHLDSGQPLSFSCGTCGHIANYDTVKFKEWLKDG